MYAICFFQTVPVTYGIKAATALDVWKSAYHKKKYEWTSLMDGEKQRFLKKLPDKFDKVLPKEEAQLLRNYGMKVTEWGSRDGAVVRALASHQCGPGSIPGPASYVG